MSFMSGLKLAAKLYGELSADGDEISKLAEMQQTIETASTPEQMVEGARNQAEDTLSEKIAFLMQAIEIARQEILSLDFIDSGFNAQEIPGLTPQYVLGGMDESKQEEQSVTFGFEYDEESLAAA